MEVKEKLNEAIIHSIYFGYSFIIKAYTGMSDFIRGFCEGTALVFLVTGLVYYGYCFVKKQKPYDM